MDWLLNGPVTYRSTGPRDQEAPEPLRWLTVNQTNRLTTTTKETQTHHREKQNIYKETQNNHKRDAEQLQIPNMTTKRFKTTSKTHKSTAKRCKTTRKLQTDNREGEKIQHTQNDMNRYKTGPLWVRWLWHLEVVWNTVAAADLISAALKQICAFV